MAEAVVDLLDVDEADGGRRFQGAPKNKVLHRARELADLDSAVEAERKGHGNAYRANCRGAIHGRQHIETMTYVHLSEVAGFRVGARCGQAVGVP